jgi:glycosyltransferase involved in cell wall biosynthesis
VTAAKPRLAFVSPLPPVRSGIADYARDLLPHVARDFDVELFVDDRHPLATDGRYEGMPVRPAGDLRRRYAEFRHVVYQLGNNLHHRFVLELARDLPGTIVLHDLVLHHLFEEIAGLEDEWERYGEALRESYGDVGAAVLQWKRWRLASERENFALPLFEPIAARSRGVIVHSRAAEAEVRRRVRDVPVARMAMGIPPEPALDRDDARRRLGIPPKCVLVGAFGFITPIKRLEVLAAALQRVWAGRNDVRLVVIGEASPGVRLERIYEADDLSSGRVVHRGYVSAEEYRHWMAATDVAVNLRYPSAGETSASLLRLLGGGKCTLVSAYRQFLEIPAHAVVRIPLGTDEEPTLVRELIALAGDPARRSRVGEAARAFVREEHSMEAAARGFRAALVEIASSPSHCAGAAPIWQCPKTSRSAAISGSARALNPAGLQMRPGEGATLDLAVRNEGRSRWIATPEPWGGHVGVGADLETVTGRSIGSVRPTLLRRDLRFGEEEFVQVFLRAPLDPGEYRIQPTLVHFGRGARGAVGQPIRLVVTADAGV